MPDRTERDMGLPRVLILGGTREARRLAERMAAEELATPVTSLAGATDRPMELPGEVRVGGFGGVPGLTEHLWRESYVAVVDATHPFARKISANAAEACDATAVPRLVLERQPWEPALGERWLEVEDEVAAARAVSVMSLSPNQRVFLALGRQRVEAFASVEGINFLLRTTDPLDPPFDRCEVVVGRGPFSLEEEESLFRRERVRVLVCRNSGGDGMAKLEAARAVRAVIVMISRPPPQAPARQTDSVVRDIDAAMAWLRDVLSARS